LPNHTSAAQTEEQGNLAAEPEEIEIITSIPPAATPAEPLAVEGPGHVAATEDNNNSEQYWQAVDNID
jgi:hypothetical protein